MAVYALWNNKGGVGKSYLTFQLSCEYARIHPNEKVVVIDLCPQANASSMLLGGMNSGDIILDKFSASNPRKTIAGYIESRIVSPYVNPQTGSSFITQIQSVNREVPANLYLITGDEQLEIQASRVASATNPGPQDAWRIVHTWISDLISDIKNLFNQNELTVFIDCNPSFSIYTELALSAADRLIIPFTADGSSKRAVRAVLALVYGVTRVQGSMQSEFYINAQRYRIQIPKIYCYIGNRLTQYKQSAGAFRSVVKEIGDEIWNVWTTNSNCFYVHPVTSGPPKTRKAFSEMFQYEIVDANTASVISSALGIPIMSLTSGQKTIPGHVPTMVNQSQLDKQQPNIHKLTLTIE